MKSRFRVAAIAIALTCLGNTSWAAATIELINDPVADGLFSEDGVIGYQYIYDVRNGGGQGRTFWLGGTAGLLGPAGAFDGREAAWYRRSLDLAEFHGVWQAWYNTSVDREGTPATTVNVPAAIWHEGTGWDANLVDEYGDFGPPGLPIPHAMENPFHDGDDYDVTSEVFAPGIGWGMGGQAGLSDDDSTGLQWGELYGISSGTGGLPLVATIRLVYPAEPGSMNYGAHARSGIYGIVTGPTGAPISQITCAIGDANCDGYVDISGDILPGFSNFTGPGSFGKTRVQGDVEGSATGATTTLDPHDGDVDVSDLLTMFGNFTGPPPDESGEGGLAAAGVGDPSIPDLIYDSATGEVTLDVDGSGIIGYVLKNGAGTFVPGNHTPILGGVTTSLAGELSEAALSSPGGANSIGFVFPTGMDLAALGAYLTTNEVSRSLGAPIVPFDLVVLNAGPAVPEPATLVLSALGLVGLGLMRHRRRRAA